MRSELFLDIVPHVFEGINTITAKLPFILEGIKPVIPLLEGIKPIVPEILPSVNASANVVHNSEMLQ